MKLRILGNYGPYPKPGQASSGYLLSDDAGETNIIVDMGPGTLSRLLEILPAEKITAVVLSHLHYDHISDSLPLMYVLQFAGIKGLPVYLPAEPAAQRELYNCPFYTVMPHEACKIGSIDVSFIPTVHPMPGSSIAFSDGKSRFVYTGDTNMHASLVPFLKGADTVLADAGLLSAAWKDTAPHLSAKLCGEVARDAGVKHLLLTHISPKADENAVLKEAQEIFPAAEIAAALKCFDV